MAKNPGDDRYGQDLEHMQELLRECEKLAERCHNYADEAAIPTANTLLRTLGYLFDAHAEALEACIEQANYLDRSGRMSEYVNAHTFALEGDDEPASEASEEAGSTKDEAVRRERRERDERRRGRTSQSQARGREGQRRR